MAIRDWTAGPEPDPTRGRRPMTDSDAGGRGGSEDRGPADEGPPAPEPVIEAFEHIAERYGLNRSCGRVFGLCYFASEPQSLDDLVSASGYAKSTVSTATQTLARLSLLSRRSGSEGGQRVYFSAETNLVTVIQDLIGRHIVRDVRSVQDAIRAAERTADGDYRDEPEADEVLDSLRADVERIGNVAGLVASLPEEELDALLSDETAEDDAEAGEPERRRSPGFYPRWRR